MVVSTETTSTSFLNTIVQGDCREVLRGFPAAFFDCVVTSPPYYGLRKYSGHSKEIGREKSVQQYVLNLLSVFDQAHHALKNTGSLWVNIADTFRGGRPLDVPEMFHYMMTHTRKWVLINRVIWNKPDAMAESQTRRFSQKYEMFYWYVKDENAVHNYYFDELAAKIAVKQSTVARLDYKFNKSERTELARMRGMIGDMQHKVDMYLEKGVNCGDCWLIPSSKERTQHIAAFPRQLVVRPIMATCPSGGNVLDPFAGSGTTCLVAQELSRNFVGVELDPEAIKEANERLEREAQQLLFNFSEDVREETV